MTRSKLLAMVAVVAGCGTKTIPLENPRDDVDGDGYTVEQGDCNDDDPLIGPAVVEACNGYDDNCDGEVDEINRDNAVVSYADTDEDGYGDPTMVSATCEVPTGYVEDNTDCDDANSAVNPGAVEVCDNADNNCDGEVDESAAVDAHVSYVDNDGDGFGSNGVMMTSCSVLDGFVQDNTDCDDNNSSINPSAVEVCDNADNNCDGVVDEAGAVGEVVWYADSDNDGYGDVDSYTFACTQPSGYVAGTGDADDSDASVRWSSCQQAFITSDPNWENYLWPGEYTDLVLTMSTNTSTTYGYVYWWDPDDSSQFWIACGSVDSSLETDLTVPDLDGYYGSSFDTVGDWHPEYVVDAVREDGFYFQNTGTEVSAAMYLELVP